ncbi:kynureninase [Hoeflea prorocentri]|uniref:Kynureninase n=1 Tax=Hoeflea prorocentri TaxID=1922333 RepID=A0A9X3UNG0_9HYPH|nr:kynureninase [Hoeflea prorocentri]MCY6383615.1 kynureninase [Hoeflea prorocentri]MDA5401415.1 kynureninase [Hoeflea prorocentri]
MMSRDDALNLDREDGLAGLRDAFRLREGLIYLDGNSLGPMQHSVARRVEQCLHTEWGEDLIASWNKAGWYPMPQTVGAKIAPLIGAGAQDVAVTDSTSVNLFKVLAAALQMRPGRRVIVSERSNFPTDLYIAEGIAAFADKGHELRLIDSTQELDAAIGEDVAVVMLTHVNYRTGEAHDMAAVTKAAHDAGAVMIWDLAHSAGAMPVDLQAADADFAIGCGYKYLNGGPGAPAFIYVAPRLHNEVSQPLSGWFGHKAPFAMEPSFEAAKTIHRFLTGTPPVLSLVALDAALDIWNSVSLGAVREKSVRLCELFIELVEERCEGLGLTLASPRDASRRGSQVCFAHADAYPVMQALIARDVIGDFRAPDILRFGFAPLYVRFVDIYDAVEHLRDVLQSGEWEQERFKVKSAVT